MFERVCLISLERRADRRARAAVELTRTTLPVEWTAAVDGKLVSPPEPWRASRGAWGCMASHLRVLAESVAAGVDSLLVFEDDLQLASNFDERLGRFLADVPLDWQLLYLGGEHLLPPRPVCPGVVRCRLTIRTHAIAMRAPAMRRVLAERGSFDSHYDHMLTRVLREQAAYAPSEWLVTQSGSPSDVRPADTGVRVPTT